MSEGLWIAIAIVAVLVVAALIVGLVRYRQRRITLTKPEPDKSIDRSGGYTASSTISFSQSTQADLPTVGELDPVAGVVVLKGGSLGKGALRRPVAVAPRGLEGEDEKSEPAGGF